MKIETNPTRSKQEEYEEEYPQILMKQDIRKSLHTNEEMESDNDNYNDNDNDNSNKFFFFLI